MSRILDTLGSIIGDMKLRGAARRLGAGKSTIGNWRVNLGAWRAEPLLRLATEHHELAQAICDLLQGTECSERAAEPTAAIPEACETMQLASQLTAALVNAVRAGRFTNADKQIIGVTIDQLSTLLHRLKIDVSAAAR